MKNSVDHIASMQNQATALADAYEAGDKSVDLTKVMLEVQKAGLAFRAMTEVRNKLVDAYHASNEYVGLTSTARLNPWLTSFPLPARGLADIPGLKQVGLLAGVAAAVAAAIWLVMWSQGQNYTVLYGQLSERESGQVMDALTAAGIEFKLNPSGAVSVPESKVQEARIRLASQGLPQSDCDGNRNDSKGFRARQQHHDGERALSIGARDGIGAHHHQGAGSAERARAFGAAQALGFLARRPQGHRLGDAAAVSRQAPRPGPGRRDRALGRLERAGIVGRTT